MREPISYLYNVGSTTFDLETSIFFKFVTRGIDMGMKTFATLSDGTKIANLDLTYEEEMIKKYQRISDGHLAL